MSNLGIISPQSKSWAFLVMRSLRARHTHVYWVTCVHQLTQQRNPASRRLHQQSSEGPLCSEPGAHRQQQGSGVPPTASEQLAGSCAADSAGPNSSSSRGGGGCSVRRSTSLQGQRTGSGKPPTIREEDDAEEAQHAKSGCFCWSFK